MNSFIKSVWGRGVAAYLIVAQVLLGWPLVVLVFLSVQQVTAQDENVAEPGLVAVPVHKEPARGTDEGLVEVKLELPSEPSDQDIQALRIFEEPLVPVGTKTEGENAALASAVIAFLERSDAEDLSTLDGFLAKYPQSSWKVALQTNLGLLRRSQGYFTESLTRLKDAWQTGKADTTFEGKSLADRAAAELISTLARFGRASEMKVLFDETESRNITGSAQALIREAREGYWIMKEKPSRGFRCGPYAVDAVLSAGKKYEPNARIAKEASTENGTSLAQLKALAEDVNLDYVPAKRSSGASWPVPSVVHWKVGHFAALTREENGKYLVKDPTFGREIWISGKALAAEGSGFALVPLSGGKAPKGWRKLSGEESAGVWGKGFPTGRDDNECPLKKDRCKGAGGMAVYNILKMRGTLELTDTPVGYDPAVGPSMNTTVRYIHLMTGQPANFNAANFGQSWVWNWGGYCTIDPSGNAVVSSGMGGSDIFEASGYSNERRQFKRSLYTGALLRVIGGSRIEREHRDGSREIYAQLGTLIGAGGPSSVKLYLKEIVDVSGNRVVLNYDTNLRLTSIVDAAGRSTVVTYKSNTTGAGFFKVYRVTDPLGRYAEFTYDAGLTRLEKIRDVVGIESSFTYGDDGFITKLTTPYGQTQFTQYVPAEDGTARGLLVVLPDGSREALESYMGHDQTTYYWDRKAMAMGAGDRSKAEQTHWLMSEVGLLMMDVPQWKKQALEGSANELEVTAEDGKSYKKGTVYYDYLSQPPAMPSPDPEDPPETVHYYVGSFRKPIAVRRMLDDGSIQKSQYAYNELGRVTEMIDPKGRKFEYKYSTNNIDLYEVRQTKDGANDLLFKATYDGSHNPLTVQDASGNLTSYTYNSRGQVTSISNAKNEITTGGYDGDGCLVSIDGPLSGVADRYVATYNGLDQIATVTTPELYNVSYTFDALDRLTDVLYPDNTTEKIIYNRLDPEKYKDRLGRWTTTIYNSMRQPSETRDSAGQIIKYEWCRCGALQGLTDAMGRITKWSYDAQGRMVKKTYPDGSHEDYIYDPVISRVATVIDPGGNTTQFTYNIDNTLAGRSYAPAPGVADVSDTVVTWDSNYRRITSVSDSNASYVLSYNPYVTNFYSSVSSGRGQVSSLVDNGATIEYDYDVLNRVIERKVDGNANVSHWDYDAAGRLSSWENSLGVFTPTYKDPMRGVGRLASLAFPNGQVTNYDWEGVTGDLHLKQIQNLASGNVALSKFDYVTDAASRVLKWKQQRGSSPAEEYTFSYDSVDQLRDAVLEGVSSGNIIKNYGYVYDLAGNRTSERVDNALMGASFNNLNEMTGGSPGGASRFKGALNEPGYVTVAGQSATMLNQTNFVANVNLVNGTNNIAVVAKDANNNTRTNNYQVVVPSGATKTLTYDGNGNLLSDGVNSYIWDARNRMVKVSYSSGASSEFVYDALNRRVAIVEKDDSSNIISTKRFVWNGLQIAEERDATNVVTKQYFAQGWRDVAASANYYYTKDHLGSVREITDGGSNQVAQYNYDPYGRATKLSGTVDSDMLYTGHYYHAESGLFLAPFRSYDSNLGRWISRDPIGEAGGLNLYGYVSNNPISLFDPLGLAEFSCEDIALEQEANNKAKEILEQAINTGFDKTYEELGLGPVANPGSKAYSDAPGTKGQKKIRTKFERNVLNQGTGAREGVNPFLWTLNGEPDVYGPDSTRARRMEQGPKNLERMNEYAEFLEELKNENGCK